jgi:hypothetical protein
MGPEINYSHNIVNIHKETKGKLNINVGKTLFGFVLFIVIFVVIIPFTLFRYNRWSILEAYMPNLDIIAAVLTWHGGPSEIWSQLYPPTPLNLYGFTSQTLLNYIALLGLSFIITRETKRTNSVVKGWSMALVMLIMTYLLPGQIISWLMDKTYNIIDKYNIATGGIWTLVVFIGFIIAAGIIASEAYILKVYRKNIEFIAGKIINFPKLLKKIT